MAGTIPSGSGASGGATSDGVGVSRRAAPVAPGAPGGTTRVGPAGAPRADGGVSAGRTGRTHTG
ncbi:hypothetical protein K4G64_34260, partial [Streptomyces sp. WAC04114]|nr:hypothetical protein [Streptomyces sp. WAC04114]